MKPPRPDSADHDLRMGGVNSSTPTPHMATMASPSDSALHDLRMGVHQPRFAATSTPKAQITPIDRMCLRPTTSAPAPPTIREIGIQPLLTSTPMARSDSRFGRPRPSKLQMKMMNSPITNNDSISHHQ